MYIGLDIGGTNISAGLFDKNRKILMSTKVKSRAKEATDVVIGQIFKVVDSLLQKKQYTFVNDFNFIKLSKMY